LSRRRGRAAAPPGEIIEVDHEEGSNLDREHSPGRLAPPFDAAERGGSPRSSLVAGVAVVAMALVTTAAKPAILRARGMGQKEQKKNNGARSGPLLNRAVPRPSKRHYTKENTMSKKLLLSLAALLAVAALAVMPAMASAATTYGVCEPVGIHAANCPGTENFKAFPAGEKVNVVSFKAPGTGNVILRNVTKTADIDCSSLFNQGHVENVGGIGQGLLTLEFAECKGSGELAACVLNPPTETIIGTVSYQVRTATTVKIKIATGFTVTCGATKLGNIKGKVTGTQAVATNVLSFTKARGLTLAGKAWTITGSDVLYTEIGLKSVYI
jgi:hypothetical protein